MTNPKTSHFLEKNINTNLQSFDNHFSLQEKLRWTLFIPRIESKFDPKRTRTFDDGIVVKVEIPHRSSRTTIRCLAVVISRMVVASYDRNTGNATLIHPGQAERPLHRCSLLCANGQSWKNRKSYRLIPVIFIDPLHRRFPSFERLCNANVD